MAYIDPATAQVPTVGEPLSAAWCALVRDGLEHVARPPGIVVTRTISQAIPIGEQTPIEWTATLRDTDGYRDSDTTIEIPAGLAGWYTITAMVRWASGTGRRIISILHNSTRIAIQRESNINANHTSNATHPDIYLSAGDTLQLDAYHTSSGSLPIEGADLSIRLVAAA